MSTIFAIDLNRQEQIENENTKATGNGKVVFLVRGSGAKKLSLFGSIYELS